MKNLIMFEKFNEGEKAPWSELKVGDIYNIYDMDNHGNILHSFGEFLGDKDGKLEFKGIYQPKSDPYLVDKNPNYTFTKKQRPKGK